MQRSSPFSPRRILKSLQVGGQFLKINSEMVLIGKIFLHFNIDLVGTTQAYLWQTKVE